MAGTREALGEDGETEEQERSYDQLAYDEMLHLIDRNHAVVWHEIEARLAEQPHPEAKHGINPHYLSNARRRLIEDGLIEEVVETTKGGRRIAVYGLRGRKRRETAFNRVARRKRLLETRYLGWAGGGRETNAIGSAGELVTDASLQQAASEGIGYRLLAEGNQVRQLFGSPIPGGPIDNGALLIGANTHIPTVITVMIEVKNLRAWLYPTAVEIYQLLHKAAQVQIANPGQLIMPVLVARRVHYLTRVMAKHLGFFTITFDDAVQPIRNLEFVEPRFVEEVRDELGYDLMLTNGDSLPAVYRAFRFTVPKNAPATATRWGQMAPQLVPHFVILRQRSIMGVQREIAVDRLYQAATEIITPRPRWRDPHRISNIRGDNAPF